MMSPSPCNCYGKTQTEGLKTGSEGGGGKRKKQRRGEDWGRGCVGVGGGGGSFTRKAGPTLLLGAFL